MCDEDKVDTFAHTFLDLVVLPLVLEHLLNELVILLLYEEFGEGDRPRLAALYVAHIDGGIIEGHINDINVAVELPLCEPFFGQEIPVAVHLNTSWHCLHHLLNIIANAETLRASDDVPELFDDLLLAEER